MKAAALPASLDPDDARRALREAAAWYAQLCAGSVSEADRAGWSDWLDGHEAHRWAWARVEHLRARLGSVPGTLAVQALTTDRGRARRAVLRGLAALAMVGGAGSLVYRSPQAVAWRADHRTGTGEIQPVTLPDGSTVVLDTGSAFDVVFDGAERRIRLRRGAVLVRTAADSARRPFRVETAQGTITALGTVFDVRLLDDATRVAVQAHAVEVRPREARTGAPRVVRAGEEAVFTARAAQEPVVADAARALWADDVLVVSDWSMVEVLEELGRYRPGVLLADPAVAALRVSGAFPLRNSDAALAALARTFPVRIVRRSEYWVRVVPA